MFRCRMASQAPFQKVQQEIDAVVGEVLAVKGSLAAAEKAGDEDQVRFLRKRLEALDTKEILLREEKKSMAAQPGGQNCCMNTDCSATNWLAYLPELVCLDSIAC